MFYKIFIFAISASMAFFLYLLGKPMGDGVVVKTIILYLMLSFNAFHCYRVEKGLVNLIWPVNVAANIFTVGAVIMFVKGGTLIFMLVIMVQQIMLATS